MGVTNKCYYIGGQGDATSDPPLSWEDASEACRNMSGTNRVDIASVNSQLDQGDYHWQHVTCPLSTTKYTILLNFFAPVIISRFCRNLYQNFK